MNRSIFRNFRVTVITLLSTAALLMAAPRPLAASTADDYAILLDAIGKSITAAADSIGQSTSRALEAVDQILGNAGDGTGDAQKSDQSGDIVHALSDMSGVVGNLNAAGRFKFSTDYANDVSVALTTAMSIRNDLLARVVAQESCGDGTVDAGEECDPGNETTAVCPKGFICLKDCSCGSL